MRNVLFRAQDRFARDQRGNVAMLFAFTAIPLLGLLGGAVDLTRHVRHKTQILTAMDSAAVALSRRGAKNDNDADRFVNGYIGAVLPGKIDPMLHLGAFDATRIDGGWRVTSEGSMETAFMPLVGINELALDLQTEVNAGGDYEIALVLDNTGSMAQNNKISALRTATGDLLDALYAKSGNGSRVKTALVPFVTSVNVKGAAFDWAWIDRSGTGKHARDNFDRPLDRIDLFRRVGAEWKGCVEAREADYDLNDTPPTSPETLFTPYFWPDDSDLSWNERDKRYSHSNNYLYDTVSGDTQARLRFSGKYAAKNKRFRDFDETPEGTNGPNKSCAGPIVELTRDRDRMDAAVRQMAPHPGSGTNIAQGMIWGLRVLSPEQPFTQGVQYNDPKTLKAMVVLTDGKNEIAGDYTGYGHLADGRLGNNQLEALRQANRNVETVCKKIRGKEDLDDHDSPDRVRLYMILFQVNDPETQRIFEDCASQNDKGETLYYLAPDNATLMSVFADIGDDLATVHISR